MRIRAYRISRFSKPAAAGGGLLCSHVLAVGGVRTLRSCRRGWPLSWSSSRDRRIRGGLPRFDRSGPPPPRNPLRRNRVVGARQRTWLLRRPAAMRSALSGSLAAGLERKLERRPHRSLMWPGGAHSRSKSSRRSADDRQARRAAWAHSRWTAVSRTGGAEPTRMVGQWAKLGRPWSTAEPLEPSAL